MPLPVQEQFAETIRAKTKTLDSGHLSMLSQPEAVADWLADIASSAQ